MKKKTLYAHEFNNWSNQEIWKYIREHDLNWKKHYERDIYRVYENGLVYSEYSNKFLKYSVNKRTGYASVARELAHRVVLKTYAPHENQENLQVNHIDGNKLNNHYTNLEWATGKENMAHAVENRMLGQMKAVKLYDINGSLVGKFNSLSDACREIGANEKSLSEVYANKSAHVFGYRVKPIGFEGEVEPLSLSDDYFFGKGVVQLTMDGQFVDSFDKMAHAYKKLGKTDNGAISQVCKGRRNSVWGYKWVYAHDYYKNKK